MKRFQGFARRIHVSCAATFVFVLASGISAQTRDTSSPDAMTTAAHMLDSSGEAGGICAVVGASSADLALAVVRQSSFLVHCLNSDPKLCDAMRQIIHFKGWYGRVSANTWADGRLPYTENLINVIVIDSYPALRKQGLTPDEVLRVLAPLGTAFIGTSSRTVQSKTWIDALTGRLDALGVSDVSVDKTSGTWVRVKKAWPAEIDEWSHYLHGADGNPVAQDTVVGPPEHFQWIAGPLWLRSHETDSSLSTLVTARGRLFYIADEAPISLAGDNPLPDKWFLIARDAFNGVPLWKVPIRRWGWREWKNTWFTNRPGDFPLNLQKSLVAAGDKLYVTLGYHAPVSQLDAKTGEILKTYTDTEGTEEILFLNDRLILSVLNGTRVRVMAVDAETGTQIWTTNPGYAGSTTDYLKWTSRYASTKAPKIDPTLNTATDGKVVALIDGTDVVCVDFKTGGEKWRAHFPLDEADQNAGGIPAQQNLWVGTVIVRDGVVLHASPNKLAAFSADTGKQLWAQPKKYIGHLWYEWKDVFVIGDLVWTWSAELDEGAFNIGGGRKQRELWPRSANGYDLQTGALKRRVPLGPIFKTQHHHRCYRDKATVRYILASRRGTEFVDLEAGRHSVHNWVRGTCHVGMMPANGLQYVPPHPCQCYIEEKLSGFVVLAAEESRDKGRGTRVESQGSRVESQGSRVESQGSRVESQGSRVESRGARVESRGSRVESRGAKVAGQGSRDESRESRDRLVRGAAYGGNQNVETRIEKLEARESFTVLEQKLSGPSGSGHLALDSGLSTDWPAYRHDAQRSGSTSSVVPADLKVSWKTQLEGNLSSLVMADGKVFVAEIDAHTVHALAADSGEKLWSYTTGARVDSPPTIDRGRVVFGSRDGWVYCLRGTDGALIWRFHAAPAERWIGAFGQLESAWPVHGSVLVQDNTVYFAAGRSSQLDGGISLYGLDTASGHVRCQRKLAGPDYVIDASGQKLVTEEAAGETGTAAEAFDENFKLPMGSLPDILMGDGTNLFMRSRAFDAMLQPKPGKPALQTKDGFLDDSYFKRVPWTYGDTSTYARLIVHDKQSVYCMRMFDTLRGLDPTVFFTPGNKGYLLFAKNANARKNTWSERIPIRVRAMALTANRLFVAGPPDVVDSKDPLGAFEARKGALLDVIDSASGKKLAEYSLTSPPVFNGIAAGNERLYLSCRDGSVLCMSGAPRP